MNAKEFWTTVGTFSLGIGIGTLLAEVVKWLIYITFFR